MNYPANMLTVLYEHPVTRPVYDIPPVVRTGPSLRERIVRAFVLLRLSNAPEYVDAKA